MTWRTWLRPIQHQWGQGGLICSDAAYREELGASGHSLAEKEYLMTAFREKLSAFYKEIALLQQLRLLEHFFYGPVHLPAPELIYFRQQPGYQE